MTATTEEILSSLKDFQRTTVDYVFDRLWGESEPARRFLVADEVGLGKTMVAKGVIAKAVEHLQGPGKQINVVYICSNSNIARQNLSRLNVVDGSELKHADRLTLLPMVLKHLRGHGVNFVSFTPGTSFQVGTSGGASPERVMLYWMLAECWDREITGSVRWKKFFEGGVRRDRFEVRLGRFDRSSLDAQVCDLLGRAIERATGPAGRPLREEMEECAAEFTHLRGKPTRHLRIRRDQLVGALRHIVARVAVDQLEPDLVILDEFQRFKDVLDSSEDDGAELARAVFDHPRAKVLLLSATPFKMYTLPDEPQGDDHYQDFHRTVRFLAGDDRAAVVEQQLRVMRSSLIAGGDRAQAVIARDRVQAELRRVMCRTERLSSAQDKDGMLQERTWAGIKLESSDVQGWMLFSNVSRIVDSHDVFEYWRSAPYPLNLMERNSYQVRVKFQAEAERQNQSLLRELEQSRGLLQWEDIESYRKIDPGNAKMRALTRDVMDKGAWKLAWLPPSLPYYELDGAYADPELQRFTKRLIFSAWSVVPKGVATMLSYEAERLTMDAAGYSSRGYSALPVSPPLQFRQAGTTFALLYPSSALARAGDPLAIARDAGAELPLNREFMSSHVRRRVQELMAYLPAEDEKVAGAVDTRWYWVAPALLDQLSEEVDNSVLVGRMRGGDQTESGEDRSTFFAAHLGVAEALATMGLDAAEQVRELDLGPRPHDLEDVLISLAIASPAVVALRALSRVAGDEDVLSDTELRIGAYKIAQGLRGIFNKPEIVALLRSNGEDRDEAYWRRVLTHSEQGCLQSVLDEYAHVLVESEGLQEADASRRAEVLAETMVEALSMRTATNTVEDVRVVDGQITLQDRRISSHFAARYGHSHETDAGAQREGVVRTAFNSPFRPFVLASTSVGQEGLDFHTYSHAVVHWNLPSNPVDLEQREGRVHRYKGHAVRKNIAAAHGRSALADGAADPWETMFAAAVAARSESESDMTPFWVYTRPGGAVIERYVPAMPLSRESQHYRRLLSTLVEYRLLLGQPRQEDLLKSLGEDASWLEIQLNPSI